MWKIYYSDSVVSGTTQTDWLNAPDSDVQVIVENKDSTFFSHRTYKESGKNVVVYGKELWDGLDVYDPFGWGPKWGALIPDSDYHIIWNTACAD